MKTFDDIKREVIDHLAETREWAISYSDVHDAIDYLHSRGYLGGVPDGYVLIPKQLASFLNGTGELEGVCFGEKNKYHKGNYWWRKYLTSAPKGETK